jgi:hypothetical protein
VLPAQTTYGTPVIVSSDSSLELDTVKTLNAAKITGLDRAFEQDGASAAGATVINYLKLLG